MRTEFLKCFSPLAGIRFVESSIVDSTNSLASDVNSSFSPLAGIRFVERNKCLCGMVIQMDVSVPLRGLGSWKVNTIHG